MQHEGQIMTVSGAVEANDFGFTLPHEHVLVDFVGAEDVGPHRYDILRTLSEKTGLKILTNTGQYKPPYLPKETFKIDVEKLASEWSAEWRDGIDGIGAGTDELHLVPLLKLLDAGYERQVLLSQDAGWYDVGTPDRERKPYTYIITDFLPMLERYGFGRQLVDQIMIDNPARAFRIGQ